MRGKNDQMKLLRSVLLFLCIVLAALPLLPFNISAAEHDQNLKVVYFYSAKCLACRENKDFIDRLGSTKGINLVTYNTEGGGCASLQMAYAEHYGVSEADSLEVPYLYFGEEAISLSPSNHNETLKKIEEYLSGKKSFENFEPDGSCQSDDKTLFENLYEKASVAGILMAGLVDGINPCAISMLLAFFSFVLCVAEKKKAIWMSTAFIVGIFLANFTFGMGVKVIYQYLAGSAVLLTFLYLLSVSVCVIAFIINTMDLINSKKEAKNQLPDGIKFKLNSAMRKAATAKFAVPTALVIGFLIGAVELACTGQVYLPTLTYMLSTGRETVEVVLLLIGYNIMFVLPLILVTVVAGVVKSPERTKTRVLGKMKPVKIIVNIFYIIMIIILIHQLFQI